MNKELGGILDEGDSEGNLSRFLVSVTDLAEETESLKKESKKVRLWRISQWTRKDSTIK